MQWLLKEDPKEQIEDLVLKDINYPPPLIQLLLRRGFVSKSAIDSFLNPSLSSLSDPFLLPDMQRAVDRIWKAIDAGENIMIFGDYDVDGVTSTTLLLRLFSQLGVIVYSFIPNRITEGYGFSKNAFDSCQKIKKCPLLITVDCGTNSPETVSYAQSAGVDVIVTDHHEPSSETSKPIALVNPKLKNNPEIKILAGVGVAFKLAHAIIKQGKYLKKAIVDKVNLKNYLDLVALGTVGDSVPLLNENRILVRYGLKQFKTTKWEGLKALKIVSKIKDEITSSHLGFQIAPRINAAGRMGSPFQALELLTTDIPDLAKNLADLLDKKNQERRKIEQQITKKVLSEIKKYFNPTKHFGLVAFGKDWHPGILGIVASRTTRHFNRPSIILTISSSKKIIRGSCRGILGFDLLLALKQCKAHLHKFGGHKMAAGIELNIKQLEPFKHAFNQTVKEQLLNMNLNPVLYADALIQGKEINNEFYTALSQFRPFGQENPEPIWLLRSAQIHGKPRWVGEKHLKFSVLAENNLLEAIAFNYSHSFIPTGFVDLLFFLKENRWRGQKKLQLQIIDIHSLDP